MTSSGNHRLLIFYVINQNINKFILLNYNPSFIRNSDVQEPAFLIFTQADKLQHKGTWDYPGMEF